MTRRQPLPPDLLETGEVLGGVTTLRVVRGEIRRIVKQIKGEPDPERVRALGELLEKLNARYERLERELLAEEPET